MALKKNIIKRIIIALASVAMIVCFIVLFVAASKDRSKAVCKAIDVTVTDHNGKVFVDKKAIAAAILRDKKTSPVGRQLSDLDIGEIEQSVKHYPWVKDAELYVDNHNVLEISISQRSPVARIFTDEGSSFYLDQEGKLLPVTGSFAIKLPVFTGVPYHLASSAKDSLVYQQVIRLSDYLTAHPFWMAQVDQINVNGNHEFELIPTVGHALIAFGDANNIDEKFDKLLTFYQKGLNNIGWGYYDTLYLQYAGQVVAARSSTKGVPLIDSLLTQDGYNLPDNKLK